MKKYLILFLLVASTVAADAATAFFFAPSPSGSRISQNQAGIVRPEDGWIFKEPAVVYSSREAVRFAMKNGSSYWSMSIEAPEGKKLFPGSFSATRFPFQHKSLMGFDLSSNGRGNNQSISAIELIEVKYDSNDKITKFAADFIQFEEPKKDFTDLSFVEDKALFGSFRYNSDIPVTPEPSTLGLIMMAACGCLGRKKKR